MERFFPRFKRACIWHFAMPIMARHNVTSQFLMVVTAEPDGISRLGYLLPLAHERKTAATFIAMA
jgi:hypothetical protein